eukprot:symbB.v1.2.007718.t1/scaffold479.1/size198797/10
MKHEGRKADSGFWNMLISASGRGLEWQKSLRLQKILLLDRVQPNEITQAAAISACGSAREWHQAVLSLRSLPAGVSLSSSEDAFGASVAAFEAAQHWNGAVELLEEMRLYALKPDLVKISSVVSACQGGQWLVALDFLNQLETKSLGLVIHAATISACAAALQWLQCLQVLEQMCDASIQHDFVLLCDVVTACMKSDCVAPALFMQVGVSAWEIRNGMKWDGTHDVT